MVLASVFMNRYSGAVESTTASDFIAVKEWFANGEAMPESVTEFHSRFRDLDLARETRRNTSIYSGVFNLLVLNEARDWRTGNAPQYSDLDDHHIVPASWVPDGDVANPIDSVLNRTPLTAETNREVIRDRLPNEYIPEMIEANGEPAVNNIMASHLISPEALKILQRIPFKSKDFDEFIAERKRCVLDAIESRLIHERLAIPEDLKDLDARIESIELGLRAAIVRGLGNEPSHLPPHVAQSIKGRIDSAAKQNPMHDAEYYASLAGQLEFCDMRELQAILTNSGLRPVFADQFSNTNDLQIRFGQLANLRNAIRHSRTVDELTRKDGEAALYWFEAVLTA